ncbi:RIP metalloprotease RseP [Cardiobacteriaceae bacterium TAE3-ERU3]|nr:RIP metalloprotease RseP [Cardiobacteriaceae bacterium TAE3-ERU3]
MFDILWGILGFVITIGILVVIHEYGHFWVARKFDVKILRFSLGFGKPLLSWRGKKDGTLYTLAPIPLGGFVQMYGEDEREPIPEVDRSRTFAAKPAWQRFLIAFAGPAVNLIFAVLAFAGLFMIGVDGIKPQVSYVAPDSIAAQAGIEAGDVIRSVDGKETLLGMDAHVALVSAARAPVEIQYSTPNQQVRTATLDLSGLRAGDELDMAATTGLYLADEWQPAMIEEVLPDAPASQIGLQAGDQIIELDAVRDLDLFRANDWIALHPNEQVTITVLRSGNRIELTGSLGEREYQGRTIGYLGIRWQAPDFADLRTTERYGFFASLGKGIDKTWYYTRLTFNMFARMIKGEVSIDNMGGPLTIGDAAGKTIQYGWDIFLNFLGIVSLSLAAINLLPIPMLDGGHMLLSAIEMIRGKPLRERTMMWVMRAGQAVVLSFMAFVILNDVHRYLF